MQVLCNDLLGYLFSYIDAGSTYKAVALVCRRFCRRVRAQHPRAAIVFADSAAMLWYAGIVPANARYTYDPVQRPKYWRPCSRGPGSKQLRHRRFDGSCVTRCPTAAEEQHLQTAREELMRDFILSPGDNIHELAIDHHDDFLSQSLAMTESFYSKNWMRFSVYPHSYLSRCNIDFAVAWIRENSPHPGVALSYALSNPNMTMPCLEILLKLLGVPAMQCDRMWPAISYEEMRRRPDLFTPLTICKSGHGASFYADNPQFLESMTENCRKDTFRYLPYSVLIKLPAAMVAKTLRYNKTLSLDDYYNLQLSITIAGFKDVWLPSWYSGLTYMDVLEHPTAPWDWDAIASGFIYRR